MIQLIRTLLTFLLLPVFFIACNSKVSSDRNPEEDAVVVEIQVDDDMSKSEPEPSDEEKSEYRGHLICEHDNIKIYAEFCLLDEDNIYGDDITAKDEIYLIRYVDDQPCDSMVLKGPWNTLSGKKGLCRITVGTDTVNVSISTPFNKVLDLRFTGVLPGCRFYRLSRHYTLNERSFPTDFQINIAVQDDAPEYIRNFINETIRDNVARYFIYSAGNAVYSDIPLFNFKDGDFAQLSRHYYTCFRRLYKKEFSYESESGEISPGPHYSYQFYAYPVWENPDSTLITWKFYNFCYLGGPHGGETEFFLTFDNKTGRILGVDDFYTGEEFKKAIIILKHQLNEYHNREDSDESSLSADLDIDSSVTAVHCPLLNENVGGKKYPRPALTRQGIVFTYQTYEKGSNADGILHFTQPYKNDHLLNLHYKIQ